MSSYTLQELCSQVDLPIRTVRYYVQIGLLAKPEGETRAARYGSEHLRQLGLIKQWSQSGLSLERIRELLQQQTTPALPLRPAPLGSVEVKSHVQVAPGLEIVIDPARAGLSSTQLRHLIQGLAALHAKVTSPP